MKLRRIAIFSLVVGFAASAATALADNTCPDLSGTYEYIPNQQADEAFKLNVTQSVAADVTTYEVESYGADGSGSQTIIADGQKYSTVVKDGEFTITHEETSICVESKLLHEVREVVVDAEGQTPEAYEQKEETYLDADQNLINASEYTDLLSGEVSNLTLKFKRIE